MNQKTPNIEDVHALLEKIAVRVEAIAQQVDSLANATPTRQTTEHMQAKVSATAQAIEPISLAVDRIEGQVKALRAEAIAAAQKLTVTDLDSEAGLWTLVGDVQSQVKVAPLRTLIQIFLGWTSEDQAASLVRVMPSGPSLQPDQLRELAARHGIKKP
jgi:hypothetical protein